jgi:XTP/dITP diphosphohydrolase
LLDGLGLIICTLNDFQEVPETLEDGISFFDNALKKARAVAKYTGETALADDSGLEVDAIGGAPGVYSARYAGPGASDEDNNRKLLENLRDIPAEKRTAAFCCTLVLCRPDGRHHRFEGRWEGRIAEEPRGEGGFGYDPVFFLPEFSMTVAQMSPEMKNRLSHRAKAFRQLRDYLQELKGTEKIESDNGA